MTYCMMGRKSDNLRGTDKTSQRDYVTPVLDNQADGASEIILHYCTLLLFLFLLVLVLLLVYIIIIIIVHNRALLRLPMYVQ